MEYLCKFLMGIIGLGLFFYMMIVGWGLEVKSVWPIILHYGWWVITLLIYLSIEKYNERKKE